MFEACLSASYGKKQVLRDISFCLPEGVTALLGRNGSGKSTLLHCIAGALPFEGSVKLDGKELKGLPAREKAKLLSILPQMLPSPDLPAEEVVGFGRSPYSARLSAKEREEVRAAMQKLGIGELAGRRPCCSCRTPRSSFSTSRRRIWTFPSRACSFLCCRS